MGDINRFLIDYKKFKLYDKKNYLSHNSLSSHKNIFSLLKIFFYKIFLS